MNGEARGEGQKNTEVKKSDRKNVHKFKKNQNQKKFEINFIVSIFSLKRFYEIGGDTRPKGSVT